MLRGCNLGGSSKLPAAPEAARSQGPDSLKNPGGVSFVGRPFPLEEAEWRFRQLRSWGFTFCRFIITWEALEHAGPGIYDEAYLAYLRKLLLIAGQQGVSVFMDPHQDVWSRWTGGDGAPAWTLEKLGFDLDKLDDCGAALTSQHYPRLNRGKPLPRMRWPVNYNRYAAATMFTLFFAGNTYAGDCKIEGQSAQDFLQERYIAAMRHCFRRLKNCKSLAGWGAMNEPHPGFAGYTDLSGLENFAVSSGPMPSPFEAMAAASGHTVKIGVYRPWLKKSLRAGSAVINPRGLSLFREGFSCPWKEAGIWGEEGGEAVLLKKDHFALYRGKSVRFTDDFLKPFIKSFIEKMREAGRPALFFIEGLPNGNHPSWAKEDGEGVVNAFHHYDGPTLFFKKYNPRFTADQLSGRIILGRKKVAAFYSACLGKAREWTNAHMGGIPCLLGEFGLPFDMNKGKAYQNGDYSRHEEALSVYYDGIDKNLLHSTIWDYTADNTHQAGDGWNGEDLSIIYNGQGRAKGGWLRPYPMATAGTPIALSWDRKAGIFRYRFKADGGINGPTEIFAPTECLGKTPDIIITPKNKASFRSEHKNEENRILIYVENFYDEIEVTINRSLKQHRFILD
jgi:hypothetical protein